MYDYMLSSANKFGGTVLEIGFGSGRHFRKMLEILDESIIYGIDISMLMVKMSSKYNRELLDNNRLKLIHADSKSLPFDDSKFDMVTTLNTLYFWKSPLNDLKEIYRVLKPGGRLFFGVNSKEIMLKNGYRPRYFNFYDQSEIENLISDAGFPVIKHQYKKLRIEDCHLFEAIK